MKIIDGEDCILGRIASYCAKDLLKGEEIVILNCDKIVISGKRKVVEAGFLEKRRRKGSSQKTPIYSKENYKLVKRTIRGMIPNYRTGRGKEALKKIRCYNGVPKEFEKSDKIKIFADKKIKSLSLKELTKNY
jgi:large subunit ribosomal protein L13